MEATRRDIKQKAESENNRRHTSNFSSLKGCKNTAQGNDLG